TSRRRHTRFSRDWSSDVCSSDLTSVVVNQSPSPDSYNAEAGTFGALTADPEGLLFPQLYVEDESGEGDWFTTTDVGLWADLPNLDRKSVVEGSGAGQDGAWDCVD